MKQIEKVLYDGFTYIDGGVCAAKGFRANGVYCGIKETPTKNRISVWSYPTSCAVLPACLLPIR